MTFQFRPAVRERVSLLIGIAGSSGSGKTYSALQLATGLAGPNGRIAVIDTEAGRALHYADQFKFDHGDLRAPFSPDAYREAIVAADEAGYDVIVIDSMSHEHEGEGGLLDWADREAANHKPPKNWVKPKTAHKRMMNRLLQLRAHLIFCLRAEEKMRVEQQDVGNGRRKMVIVPAADLPLNERWQPIAEKRFAYELTASFLMTPDRPGVPLPLKLQEQHRHAFPEGSQMGSEAGEKLAAWASGGKPPADTSYSDALAIADQGTDAFRAWWKDNPDKRDAIKARLPELQAHAEAADGRSDDSGSDDDPFAQSAEAPAETPERVDVARLDGTTVTGVPIADAHAIYENALHFAQSDSDRARLAELNPWFKGEPK